MARPALSASRTTELIDLFTASPGRGFSMAEIVRETKINVASLHAILAVLVGAGYLTKLPREKRYILGPSLAVAGEVAVKSHPLIGPAKLAAEHLSDELGVAVLLSTEAGENLLALHSVEDRAGRIVGMRSGQRRPISRVASLFRVAWSPPAVIDAWIAEAGVTDEALVAEWRRAAALIKERGFQLTLAETDEQPLPELVAEMASSEGLMEYKSRSMGLVGSHGQRLTQPEAIDPNQRYDVSMIAAPIFDQREAAHLSLALGGFAGMLTGAEIEHYAKRLMQTCLRVMRS